MCITKLKEHYLSKHDQKLTKHSSEFRKVYHDHLDVTCYICAKYFPDKNSLENHKIKHHKTRERTRLGIQIRNMKIILTCMALGVG